VLRAGALPIRRSHAVARRALTALLLLASCAYARKETALDRYVKKPDPTYRFEMVSKFSGQGYTAYVLDLTSQTWRTAAEVDRPVWKHWLTVVKPDQVKSSTGVLFITGGANNSKPPEKVDPLLLQPALDTNSVVAELRMVPNQPLTFAGDKPRSEDAMIAYTWDKFLRTGDETWPARLPMTKSAVRAMDAVTSFCASAEGGAVNVDRFVVAGASKRGWTTWTTAAVDSRVVAIVPLVIDLLNVEKSFRHHFQVYGFYAPAVKDYEDMEIMRWQGTPEYHDLMKIEEPYEYRDRLTLPKLMVNAAGDQFFLPDSSQFYFDDLKGEKALRYVPNADHSLRNSDVAETFWSFYAAVLENRPRPKFSWAFAKDGSIEVKLGSGAADKPTEVKLWQATNPEKRDFRLMTIGPAYRATPLTESAPGQYSARVDKPAKGWTAFFVELTFPMGKYPLKLTSGVRVTPDVLPFPPPKHEPPKR
jgi:PhoPQ-activated pathogenicity-related protein